MKVLLENRPSINDENMDNQIVGKNLGSIFKVRHRQAVLLCSVLWELLSSKEKRPIWCFLSNILVLNQKCLLVFEGMYWLDCWNGWELHLITGLPSTDRTALLRAPGSPASWQAVNHNISLFSNPGSISSHCNDHSICYDYEFIASLLLSHSAADLPLISPTRWRAWRLGRISAFLLIAQTGLIFLSQWSPIHKIINNKI